MSRKTKEIVIGPSSTPLGADNRDIGSKYLLTEMSASRAEKWASRAWLAIAHAGKQAPPEVAQAGMVGFAIYTFAALADAKFDDIEPLMDEMMGCVEYIMPIGSSRSLVEEDVQEVVTRAYLRREVLDLHVGFSVAGWLLKNVPAPTTEQDETTTTSTTPTSPD